MRSDAIKGHLHLICNVTKVTLQNEFYNIFADAAVKVPRGVLCVV